MGAERLSAATWPPHRGHEPLRRTFLYHPVCVSPANKRTPPDQQAIRDGDLDDLDGPTSEIRPLVPLLAVPWLAITLEGLRFLPLDARAAYLLSLVDGHCTVETILDICVPELEREEALGLLARLIQLGAIELRDP